MRSRRIVATACSSRRRSAACRAAPNLLGAALSERLAIPLLPLKLVDKANPFRSEAEFAAYGDYARLDYQTRSALQYAEDEVEYDADRLRGRRAIFVNDINVTGSQKRWIDAVLRRALPAALHWLFIVDVEPAIGLRFPHLEDEINRSRLGSYDEIVAFLRGADLRCTTKLVARLLGFGADSLERIFRSIGGAQRRSLMRAMRADGTYAPEFLHEKLAFAGA